MPSYSRNALFLFLAGSSGFANADGLSGLDGMVGVSKSIADLFISLSSEYPAMLQFIYVVFGAIGVAIGVIGLFQLFGIGNRNSGEEPVSVKKVLWKLFGGASLIDLSLWCSVWSDTLWMNKSDIGMESYVASGGGDYGQAALMAALGIIVIAGVITMGRAYMSAAQIGTVSGRDRSTLGWNVISRIIAGSLMISSFHVAKLFDNSASFNWLPN